MRTASFIGLLTVSSSLVAASARASAPQGDELREQQVAYSKTLYQEGLEAMESKDFEAAIAKFKEAYRYAPNLHLFTYNIGSAAEHAGDCDTARTYYGMFLDLVPKHAERKKVARTHRKLQEQCPYDMETQEKITAADREQRAARRAEEDAERALRDVLVQLQRSVGFYQSAGDRFSDTKAFRRAARRKKWHARRMVALLKRHGVDADAVSSDPVEVPASVSDACRKASVQEKRNVDAFEEVLAYCDSRDLVRVMKRFRRRSEIKDRPAFEACSG